MPEQAWLDSLVAGETVAVVRGCGRSVDVARVERVTRGRKWLYVNGAKFWAETGAACGPNAWCADQLVEPTVSLRHTYIDMLAGLTHTDWSSLPLSTLEAVLALLDKARKEQGA